MTKFNFFLVVEALLLTLGLITIFNNDITSFIFILVLTLLAVRFLTRSPRVTFVLTILFDLTFSGFHVEYLCGACYPSGCGLCHDKPFFTGQEKNRYALIQFKEDNLNPRAVRKSVDWDSYGTCQ